MPRKERLKLEYFERSVVEIFNSINLAGELSAAQGRDGTAIRLREFCAATGKDLGQLNDFFSQVDGELMSYSAG